MFSRVTCSLTFLYFLVLVLASACGVQHPAKQSQVGISKSGGCTATSSSPESEITAFSKTVRVEIAGRCVDCHANRQSPMFAQSNLTNALALAKPLMNGSPAKFEVKAGDGHCGSNCNDGASMKKAIEAYSALLTQNCQTPNPAPSTNTNSNSTVTGPAAPSNLSALAILSNQINLSWSDNSSNEAGFAIQISADGLAFSDLATVSANTTSYSSTNLSPLTQYFFRVIAFNDDGSSAFTSIVNTTTLPPLSPSGLTVAAASSSQLNVSWVDNSTDEAGFKLERSTDGVTFSSLVMLPSNTTTYSNTGLTASTRYYYRVQAYVANGASPFSAVNSALTLAPPTTAPAAPSNLVATAISASQINLSWTDASNNETGFRIQRSIDNVNFTDLILLMAGVTSYSNSGLSAATRYYYRIQSYNAVGNSAYTPSVSAVTAAATPPVIPSGLVATSASSSQINLTWVDTSNDETGFRIQRSSDNVTFADLTTVAANVTTYSNTGLTAATRYYYRVQSFNAIGASAYTASVNATTGPATPPGKLVYDTKCAGCHRLGAYDTNGGDPNLSGKAALVDSKFPTATSSHKSQTLTATQKADLKAFIAMY